MKRLLLLFIALFATLPLVAVAQGIGQLQQFTSTSSPSSAITQTLFGKAFRLTGQSSGCAQFSANGTLTSTGVSCGTGSGGGTFPFDPTNPSVDLVYMTSGTLTFRVEAPMKVARGAKTGTPVAAEPEEIPAGTEFTLSEGDAALFPPNTGGEARNDSDQEATAWVVDLVLVTSAAGTPTP